VEWTSGSVSRNGSTFSQRGESTFYLKGRRDTKGLAILPRKPIMPHCLDAPHTFLLACIFCSANPLSYRRSGISLGGFFDVG
jgi:hypothetical protein